jgi:subtilisin family serine protease
MDKARQDARVDEAVQKLGVTGSAVLVGIMDRGIDWNNADFRNPDGSTRIAYIFDLTDDTGARAPGNPYQMGTIYAREAINEALRSGVKLNTRDAVGHGTKTAGIAAGNGRNRADLKYRGVAINSTIIAIKIVSDGAAAHDDQPSESPFYKPERIPVAIGFLIDKAREMKLPCVMVLNIGSVTGSRDGTSDFARKIDAQFGPGKPG